jgi:hypothetical protein
LIPSNFDHVPNGKLLPSLAPAPVCRSHLG